MTDARTRASGLPVSPVDEIMRRHEGDDMRTNMQDYAEDMGLTKPRHPGSPWWAVAFVVLMAALLLLTGCATNAGADDTDDKERLKEALQFLCALTPRGRALAIIDLNQDLDDSNISFGLGCESDQFRINIQEGDLSGRPAHRLTLEAFYIHTEGEGST